jgi:pyruvate dehydrogenase E1 component
MRQMLEEQEDVFYYVTVMNENYAQPSLPARVEQDIVKGLYRYSTVEAQSGSCQVRLLGSGTILLEVIAAADLLARDWGVGSEVWSVTSFTELARNARGVERWNRLHPLEQPRRSHVASNLDGDVPVIAATDYVRAVPQLIASYIDPRYVVLGTDGFGRSDTRNVLREFFEVNRHHVVLAALSSLVEQGVVAASTCAQAIERYNIDTRDTASWEC